VPAPASCASVATPRRLPLIAAFARGLLTSQIPQRSWGRVVVFLCVGAVLIVLVVTPFVSSQPSEEVAWLFAIWFSWGSGVLWIFGRQSFSPPALGLMMVMLVFVIVPATIAVASGRTVFAGVDYTRGTLAALQISAAAQVGLTAGVIIIHSILNGGSAFRPVTVEASRERLNRTGIAILSGAAVALALLTVTSGANLGQYVALFGNSSYGSYSTSAVGNQSGYLGSLIAISGVCIMVAVVASNHASRRARPLLLFALALLAAVALVGGGVRGHLVVSLLAASLLWVKIRRSPRRLAVRTLTVCAMCALLLFTAIIGVARGSGHPPITPANLVDEQFGTGANLFAPLAGLAQTIPAQQNYFLGSSYLEALYFPIPRALWPDKPQGAIVQVIGSFSNASNGESFLEYGEMYANFGVVGALVGCVLFAALLELMWIRFATSVDGRGLFIYPALIAVMLDIFTRAYAVSELAGLLGFIVGAIFLPRFLHLKVFARP
jgi:oligosaccharide repeat unit polymerase